MIRFTHHFSSDLIDLMGELKSGRQFAFARFADGELALMNNTNVSAADGWTSPGPVWLSQQLEKAMAYDEGLYYVGIACPCCDNRAHQLFMEKLKHRQPWQIGYSNLFVNANYKLFKKLILYNGFLSKCAIVSSGDTDYTIPANAVNSQWYEQMVSLVDEMRSERRPILVAAGPLAEPIIHRYWATTRPRDRVAIVDIGSALDWYIHDKKVSRSYQLEGHRNSLKFCMWSKEEPSNE